MTPCVEVALLVITFFSKILFPDFELALCGELLQRLSFPRKPDSIRPLSVKLSRQKALHR